MLSANRIPDLANSSVQNVRAWRDLMIDFGFNTNPSDAPSEIVTKESRLPALDESTDQKVRGIYQKIFYFLGDRSYEIASIANMNWPGYAASPLAPPGK